MFKAKSLLLCCFLACLLASVAHAAVEWRVAPGIGVGPFVLGAEWKKSLPPLTLTEYVPQDNWGWVRFEEGVELQVQNERIAQIIVHHNVINTRTGPATVSCRGVKIGDTPGAMEAVFGKNYKYSDLKTGKSEPAQSYYAYTEQGIAFQTRNGAIYLIIVWPRK